jgi:hypothetical protein
MRRRFDPLPIGWGFAARPADPCHYE